MLDCLLVGRRCVAVVLDIELPCREPDGVHHVRMKLGGWCGTGHRGATVPSDAE